MAEGTTNNKPQAGDMIVIYISKAKEDQFEEAKKIVLEDFAQLISETREINLTHFYVNPETCEVGAIQFFKSQEDANKWFKHEARLQLVKKLEPTLKEPTMIHQFALDKSVG